MLTKLARPGSILSRLRINLASAFHNKSAEPVGQRTTTLQTCVTASMLTKASSNAHDIDSRLSEGTLVSVTREEDDAMTISWVFVGSVAWFCATFLPICLFHAFRRLATRTTRAWIVHLIFAPTQLAVWYMSAFFLTWADGDQDRTAGERGLGILLLPSMLILLIAFAFYYRGIAASALKRAASRRGNGT